MSHFRSPAKTILAAAVLLLAAGCSVAVPESRAPEVGALRVTDPDVADQDTAQDRAEPSAATPSPSAATPSDAAASSARNPAVAAPGGKPLNRAEQLLPKVNVQPWRKDLPVVVQSVSKDMQCSIGPDSAACHLLSDVVPRPGDVRGQCAGASQYHGGYAVVTVDSGAQYGLCGDGIPPMEAENMAGPAFPGPWLQDGQTVRVGNIVCERTPGAMTCAHLRTGHGFLISVDNYELW
jgi:hypothetical protein